MKPPDPDFSQRFSDWQVGLITVARQPSEGVAQRQAELCDAVDDGVGTLTEYLRSELEPPSEDVVDAPGLPRRLTPAELRDPPLELERGLWASWAAAISPREASQPQFWTRCHTVWLGQGDLGEPIAEALTGTITSGGPEAKRENAVRNFLRRCGGLPSVRGKRSALVDCPLSRAWWRGFIAEAAASASEGQLDAEDAHRILHASNDAWARFAGDAISRITVVNSAKLRAALLCEYADSRRGVDGVPGRELELAGRLIARDGGALLFDLVDWEELRAMAADAVAEAQDQLSKPQPDYGSDANP